MAAGPGGASHDACLLFDWQGWSEREGSGHLSAEHLRHMALCSGWLIIVSKFKNGKKQAQIRVLFGERENPPKCNPSSGASSYFLLQLAGIIKSDIAV